MNPVASCQKYALCQPGKFEQILGKNLVQLNYSSFAHSAQTSFFNSQIDILQYLFFAASKHLCFASNFSIFPRRSSFWNEMRKKKQNKINSWLALNILLEIYKIWRWKSVRIYHLSLMSSRHSNQRCDELICEDQANGLFTPTITMYLITEQDSSNFSLNFFWWYLRRLFP